MLTASSNCSPYDLHKHPALRFQENVGSRCHACLPFDRFLLRVLCLSDRGFHALRPANEPYSTGPCCSQQWRVTGRLCFPRESLDGRFERHSLRLSNAMEDADGGPIGPACRLQRQSGGTVPAHARPRGQKRASRDRKALADQPNDACLADLGNG